MARVDSLKDLIPFWREQVEAASRGVELRFEEFLDQLEKKQREIRESQPVWSAEVPAWALDDQDAAADRKLSSPPSRDSIDRLKTASGATTNEPHVDTTFDWGALSTNLTPYELLEEIARIRSASNEQMQGMLAFYNVRVSANHFPALLTNLLFP